MNELAEHMISTWREELSSHYRPFIGISPEDSVCSAVRKLSTTKVHRLPVIDPVSGNAVYVVTHKRILKFIHLFVSVKYTDSLWMYLFACIFLEIAVLLQFIQTLQFFS